MRRERVSIVAIVGLALVTLLSPPVASSLPVFPGAIGFGTDTPAGRGGTIYRVTTLDDDNDVGSLRHAVELASGPRVIIFEISGTIEVSRYINIDHPFITIAGQTAPAPGITIKGSGFRIRTHDVLIQHIAVRPGGDNEPPQTCAQNPNRALRERDSFRVEGPDSYNIVLDHVSASWTTDQLLSFWSDRPAPTHDFTVSHSLLAEPLNHSIHCDGRHPFGPMYGRNTHSGTFLRNVVGFAEARNPSIIDSATGVVIVNNYIFWPGTHGEGRIQFGPKRNTTPPDTTPLRASAEGNVIALPPNRDQTYGFHIHALAPSDFELYLANNRVWDERLDRWLPANGDPWDTTVVSKGSRILDNVKADARPPSAWNIGLVPWTTDLERRILASAGSRPLERDPVDRRIVNRINTCRTTPTDQSAHCNLHLIDNPSQVGGYATLPDNRRTLDEPADPGLDADQDGYTNLEEWLHDMATAVQGPPPLDDTGVQVKDFEHDQQDWIPFGAASWERVTDAGTTVYRQTNVTGDARAILGGTVWTNQSIQADAKLLSFNGTDRWFGLFARYLDEDNHYYVTARTSNVLELRRKVAGEIETLASAPLTVSANTPYRLRLEAVGPNLKVYLNGNPLPALQGTDSALTRGSVALGMFKASAEYDNVVVTQNAQTPLAAPDDFEIGNAGAWTPGGASDWAVVPTSSSSVYRQSDDTGDAQATIGSGWGDQIMEAHATALAFNGADRWFGLMTRYVDTANYYYVTLRNSGSISLRKIVGGIPETLDTASLSVTTHTPYRLRFEAIGSSLKVYVNGQVMVEATDTSLPTGGAGLRMFKAQAQFDNVTILHP